MAARKTAVVTGASRGIGRALALALAGAGYDVAVACLQNEARLQETAREIRALGGACMTFVGDLGDPMQCGALFARVLEQFGAPDLLVNNAGISHWGLVQDTTPDDWRRVIDTNLSAVFYCSRLAAAAMLPRKRGVILNISSVWGGAGASCEAAYCAAKGGVDALTRALGKELAPSGIAVNAIACGAIDTEMNGWMTPDERAQLAAEIAAGRFGTPEEVAAFALRLIEAGPYLTGQVIPFDGGWR